MGFSISYPLVMTNSLWKIQPFLRTVNHLFRLEPSIPWAIVITRGWPPSISGDSPAIPKTASGVGFSAVSKHKPRIYGAAAQLIQIQGAGRGKFTVEELERISLGISCSLIIYNIQINIYIYIYNI